MVKSTPADRDSLVRSVLTDRGDSGETPRHTLFYFYEGNLDQLRRAAIAAGYQVSPTVKRDGLVPRTRSSRPSCRGFDRELRVQRGTRIIELPVVLDSEVRKRRCRKNDANFGIGPLVLETMTAVDEDSFAVHARQMNEWAELYGCDFDGWECQLLIQ